MNIQKRIFAALLVMTLAVESGFSQFALTPIPGLPDVASGSVAWADFDSDGRLDFLLSGSVELSLWRNTGDGFTNVTGSMAPELPGLYDSAVAWGDYDDDGRLDLLITGLTNLTGRAEVSQLWRNSSNGFTRVPIPGLPGVAQSSAGSSDYNGDGRLDFLIAGTTNGNASGTISQLWQNTGGGFTNVPIPGLPGVYFGSMAWGDFDNDGRPDFFLTGLTNESANDAIAQLWRNTGNGFTNVPTAGIPRVFVSSFGWGDYDNDGRLDFLLDGLSATGFVTQLWRNTGEGFINVPVPGLAGIGDGSLAWADYDNDGRLDFLITGLANGATRVAELWRNTGSGFTNVPVAGLRGNFDNSLAWGDYDNDGRVDFLIAGTTEGGNVSELWRNSVATLDVSVPDAGLNAAIRQTLQKPLGPLTAQDLLNLTNLDASRRNVSSIVGLEAARNLVSLDLQANRLTNFSLPPALTKLSILNVSGNPLTNCTLPDGLTNLRGLFIAGCGLSDFRLPGGLSGLNSLSLENNQLSALSGLSNITGLIFLDLSFNAFTNFSLPSGLTNLSQLVFDANALTNLDLPGSLGSLTELHLSQNQFTSFTAPAGLTNLAVLNLFFNQLTNITLPDDLTSLGTLDLDFNRFTDLDLPQHLNKLRTLKLRSNLLTDFSLPSSMTQLKFLDIGENRLSSVQLPAGLNQLEFLRLSGNTNLTALTLPVGLTNLTGVFLRFNQLTTLTLPSDLGSLVQIDVLGNLLTSLSLPSGLTNLVTLVLSGNQLTNLTLPPDMTRVATLVLNGNPLTTVVLSEPLAVNLAEPIASLRDDGISVLTFPLVPELVHPRMFPGRFQFGITGPPGFYSALASTNLTNWEVVGTAVNSLGSINFNDISTNLTPDKFYRVLLQPPPTNMVFIPPNTFLMGSPSTELHRQTNEGPQTTVTLSRGFWIGKYEVTQGEYLSVMSTNPSQFPGDLSRPVSSVSWPDATNYCWNITQRDRAAGRIPPGSQYRLPTEAEWECAARAGTTTRFSYGDDPDYSELPKYAWQSIDDDGLTVHPVGQKLPNPWGLYDTMGNVFEWCQDWLGPLPGGSVIDPVGPDSNPIGWKIMRGGAFDFGGGPGCRSANRLFFASHPALNDWSLGFRIVLVTGP